MDLSRVTFPTFVLEPRSMLERITDFMSHPDLIFGQVFVVRLVLLKLDIPAGLRTAMTLRSDLYVYFSTTWRAGTSNQRVSKNREPTFMN
jgi:hypothetical protein